MNAITAPKRFDNEAAAKALVQRIDTGQLTLGRAMVELLRIQRRADLITLTSSTR